MEVEHTPGPWKYEDSNSYRKRGQVAIKDVAGTIDNIAWIRYGRKASQANARLIAAAPDLLSALSGILESEWMVSHDWGGDRDAVLEAGYAALIKATEET